MEQNHIQEERLFHDSPHVDRSFEASDNTSPIGSEDLVGQAEKSADERALENVSETPPDGGLAAWLQVLGAFMLFFNNWGLFAAFGAFQTYYETVLLDRYSASSIAWIGTFQGAMMIGAGVLSGPLCDSGYIRSIVLTSTFLIVFGHMMLSLATQYYQVFLAQGLVAGVGMGLIYVPSVAIVSTYFTVKRPLALGVCGSGTAIGGIIYPIVFRRLLPRVGFPWATRTMCFIALATLAVPFLLLKPRTRPAKVRKLIDYSAFKDIPFLLATLAGAIFFLGLFVPYVFISTYGLIKLDISPDLAFYLVSILNAGSFFGRLILGSMAMKYGIFRVYHVTLIICAILILAWIGVHNLAGTIVFAVFYGFFSGGLVVIVGAAMPLISPSLDVVGTRFGMSSVPTAIAVLISAPIASALSNVENGQFLGLQLWGGLTMVVAAVVLTFPHVMLAKRQK